MKLYLDTSVFGGFYDSEFDLWTKLLFRDIISKEVKVLYSDVVNAELVRAPEQVKNLVSLIPSGQFMRITTEDSVEELAQKYIAENVVGKTSYLDCLHIALATIHEADVLVSWNFKHIVNVIRIRGYNSVNLSSGYANLEIRSPREIIDHEY